MNLAKTDASRNQANVSFLHCRLQLYSRSRGSSKNSKKYVYDKLQHKNAATYTIKSNLLQPYGGIACFVTHNLSHPLRDMG